MRTSHLCVLPWAPSRFRGLPLLLILALFAFASTVSHAETDEFRNSRATVSFDASPHTRHGAHDHLHILHDVGVVTNAPPALASWHIKLIGRPNQFIWHNTLPLLFVTTDQNFVAALSINSGALVWRARIHSAKGQSPKLLSCGSLILAMNVNVGFHSVFYGWHAISGELEFARFVDRYLGPPMSLACQLTDPAKIATVAAFTKRVYLMEYDLSKKEFIINSHAVNLIEERILSNGALSSSGKPAYIIRHKEEGLQAATFSADNEPKRLRMAGKPTNSALFCTSSQKDFGIAVTFTPGSVLQIHKVSSDFTQAVPVDLPSNVQQTSIQNVSLFNEIVCTFMLESFDGKVYFYDALNEKFTAKFDKSANSTLISCDNEGKMFDTSMEPKKDEFITFHHSTGSTMTLKMPIQHSTYSLVTCRKTSNSTLVVSVAENGIISAHYHIQGDDINSPMKTLWTRYEILANLTQIKALDVAKTEEDAFSGNQADLTKENSNERVEITFGYFFSRYVNRLQSHSYALYHALQLESIKTYIQSVLKSLGKSIATIDIRTHKLIIGLSNSHIIAIDSANPHQIYWMSEKISTGEETQILIDEQTTTSKDTFLIAGANGTQKIDARNGEILFSNITTTSGMQDILQSRNATHVFKVRIDGEKVYIVGYSIVGAAYSKENYRVKVPGKFISTWTPSAISQPSTAPAGRVMSDRSVKYKYINSNILVVMSSSSVTVGMAGFTRLHVLVLDSVTGKILGNFEFDKVELHEFNVHVRGAENAIFVTYFAQNARHSIWHTSVIELYVPEIVTNLDSHSLPWSRPSHLDENLQKADWSPEVRVATYEIAAPRDPVLDSVVSVTRNGLSLREVLYLTEGSLFKIPQRVLDAMRVDASTNSNGTVLGYRSTVSTNPNEALPDGAIPYSIAASIIDSNDVLSREIDLRASKISSHATQFESTSIVICYGGDLFYTAIAPSGDFDQLSSNFPKVPVISACFFLFFATLFSKYYLRRKVLDSQWK